ILRRPRFLLLLLGLFCVVGTRTAQADTPAAPPAAAPGEAPVPVAPGSRPPPSENVTINLINLLVERRLITREDADKLIRQAEDEAAEARAQAAATQLVLAHSAQVEAQVKQVAQQQAAATPAAPAPASVSDNAIHVTYVPEVVKAQLRDQIKQEVMAEARQENWAAPNTLPAWVSRFTPVGDIRIRYDGNFYPSGNLTGFDNNYWNYNAINTSSTPFDYTAAFAPFPNVDQTRNRVRLRARLGTAVDLNEGFTAGLRLATGENNSPVTENQSLGAASSGQGGNFSKYALWLDRAFLKYEIGGLPDKDLSATVGRFDNPFFATSVIWADDLGFDGAVLQGRYPLDEYVMPFFSAGLFPVFNTDFNFATNSPNKFKSEDKWLYGGQLGVTWEITEDLSFKTASAYYYFQDVQGKVSRPFTPLTTQDAGNTDDTRPAFAQRGNTYIALRNIVPDATLNGGGTSKQYQYFGLATPFHELAFTAELDYTHFEPFVVSLSGEYVNNLAFHRRAIERNGPPQLVGPVNNFASNNGGFDGGDAAWIAVLKVGKVALQKRWDWNASLSYRRVESDAVVDGFCDSDFGGGGTNLKGYTFSANLALSSRVSLGIRWMSADSLAGPPFKDDTLQFDINGKL
ncbi:MAG TPA: putative porin, partial [Opitutaceae bacterium]|nr:putative porin [Opitutaceae bacterium]